MRRAETLERLWETRKRLILSILILLALISAAVGVWNGSHRSQDFQYSGERVLLQHIDPWANFLAGDPLHAVTMTQIPNYLPILYVVLVPFGLVSLTVARTLWAVTNLIFAVTSATWAARFYRMRGGGVVAVVCLLLMSTAARNTMGNGQQSLLVVFFWSLSLWLAGRSTGDATGREAELLGASYFKFTFGPPVLLFVLFRWGIRAALRTGVPAVVALLLVWLWLSGPHNPHGLLTLALEPLAVARHGFTPGPSDPNLMNVLEIVLGGRSENARNALELGAAMLVCLPLSWFAFARHREASLQWHMALLGTMSYSLFKHHTYDAVVLLFPLCFGLSRWCDLEGRWIVGLIAYLFYGERVIEAAHLHPWWFCVPDFLVLMAVLVLTYRLGAAGRGEIDSEVLTPDPV